mgnify:FL=1
MSIEDKISSFIKNMGYLNDEHVLGVFFYGSYLTGLNTDNSDIDLHIIFDNTDHNHLIRGNKIVDGTRIEYFEKPIDDIYQTVNEDYINQNNATLTIFGTSKIIYAKDTQLKQLQEYVINKFSNPLPPLSDDEAKEQVSILNNRMEKLKTYAETNNPYFEHLYHLTIDKIRRFYHNLMGIPRIETSKGFRIYTDEKYRNAFCINNIPKKIFIEMYFKLISDVGLNKIQKYNLLNEMYEFTKRNVTLGNDYRIPIKSRNIDFDAFIIEPTVIENRDTIEIPLITLKKILKFIKEMDYSNNNHCLGVIVYGSSLTGFNTNISDIDLHVVFDNQEPERLIRGNKIIDGTKIEYFEKPIKDIYLEIENGYLNQNNASFAIIGKGTIVFEKDNKLSLLQQYAIDRFSTPMPCLSRDDAREQVSIINNRMEKLERFAIDNDPRFEHLSHLTIDKIRKFYHKSIGISKIPTSKVYRIYTDEDYRNSVYKENPEPEFINMYLNLITINFVDKLQKLQMIKEFYNYTTRNINLGNDYRILIKSRNTVINKKDDKKH